MNLKQRALSGAFEVAPEPHRDERGFLARCFDAAAFRSHGLAGDWRQVLHSHTAAKNTLRGLHVQMPPYAEDKLVMATAGRMFWVVVDVRAGSATFGEWEGFDLVPGERGLYAAAGFAHGCLALTDSVDLLICSSRDYSPEHGVGIWWCDEELAITWPLDSGAPNVSEAHAAYPTFASFRENVGAIDVQPVEA